MNEQEIHKLINEIGIEKMMNIISHRDDILLLEWYYPHHLAEMWDCTEKQVNKYFEEIKKMITDTNCSGGFDIHDQIADMRFYFKDWGIKIKLQN
jgi:hypothetical protein